MPIIHQLYTIVGLLSPTEPSEEFGVQLGLEVQAAITSRSTSPGGQLLVHIPIEEARHGGFRLLGK